MYYCIGTRQLQYYCYSGYYIATCNVLIRLYRTVLPGKNVLTYTLAMVHQIYFCRLIRLCVATMEEEVYVDSTAFSCLHLYAFTYTMCMHTVIT